MSFKCLLCEDGVVRQSSTRVDDHEIRWTSFSCDGCGWQKMFCSGREVTDGTDVQLRGQDNSELYD